MDDYAHHPRELRRRSLRSRRCFRAAADGAFPAASLHPDAGFYREFAEALSHADRVVLLPIYPAREEPIPGVESEMIGRLLTVPGRSATVRNWPKR